MQLYVFVLLLFCVATTVNAAARITGKNELQNTINCKSVCGDCNCRGFYCGEECICECDSDNDDDIKCLATMHNKCKKLQFPFEVLIQGPSGNRFMRSALLFEEMYEQSLRQEASKSKRETIVLYKPQATRIKRQSDDPPAAEDNTPPVEPPPEDEPMVGAPQSPADEQVPAAAEDNETNEDAPVVGVPLALALPAVRAKTKLTAKTIRAQYEATLAALRAKLAARRKLIFGAAAAAIPPPGIITPGIVPPAFVLPPIPGFGLPPPIPPIPPLPVQPLGTY